MKLNEGLHNPLINFFSTSPSISAREILSPSDIESKSGLCRNGN